MVPSRLTAFFNFNVSCQNGGPLFGMLAELAPHVGGEAESNIAQSFEDSRSIAAVKTLQHCCIKLDIQKGGSSEGSPTIVKNNALMSSSSKSRSIEKPLF